MFFSSFEKRNKKLKQRLANNPDEPFSLEDVFRDENLRQLISQQLHLNKKSRISLRDLESIQILEAAGQNISSLDGIEFLNNLIKADFSNNNISSLPDYSENQPNLGLNKNTLLRMELKGNPFLNQSQLFSLDNTENRKRFFGAFTNPYSRFDLGEIQDNVFSEKTFNPKLIQLYIEKFIPRSGIKDLNETISDVFTKYLIGKHLFYNYKISEQDYIFDQGQFKVKKSLGQDYISEKNIESASELIEQLIPENDKYLLRSIINTGNYKISEDLKSRQEVLDYYKKHSEEISPDYIVSGNEFLEKGNYSDLKPLALNESSEERLALIENENIKNMYLKYLEYHHVLDEYAKDKNSSDVVKYLNKSDDFINNFLDQYQKLQDNHLLSELQKAKIAQAEPALEKFVNNFAQEAQSFFEQDIFGLEVDMKYIDMLAEANRKF